MPSLLAFNSQPMTQIKAAFGTISTSYSLVGTFSSWMELGSIVSTLDDVIILSFDGINDHLTIPKGSTTPVIVQLNFKSNRMTLPTPTIYAKCVTSVSVGSIYISGFTAYLQ